MTPKFDQDRYVKESMHQIVCFREAEKRKSEVRLRFESLHFTLRQASIPQVFIK